MGTKTLSAALNSLFLKLALLACSALACTALNATELTSITLNLGETRLIDTPFEVVQAYSSNDSVVGVFQQGNSIEVKGIDLGEVSVTLFGPSGQIQLHRVRVITQGVEISDSLLSKFQRKEKGSRAAIGTRLGFRSASGWLDTLVSQEEFARLHYPSSLGVHQLFIQTSRPLQYPEPKALRVLDKVSYQLGKPGSWHFSLGDTTYDVNGMRHLGPIRGGRVDWDNSSFHPYAFGGFVRAGVEEFLSGSESSAIYGVGQELKLGQFATVSSHILGFKSNSLLNLPEGGTEGRVQLQVQRKWLRGARLVAVADQKWRTSIEGDATVGWDWLELYGGYAHSPDNLSVYSVANRFAKAFESYSGGARTIVPGSGITASVSVSKGQSIGEQDLYDGRAVLDNKSAQLDMKWGDYEGSLMGSIYDASFVPFNPLAPIYISNSEQGRKVDWQQRLKLSEPHSLSLGANASDISSTRFDLNYENQELAAGWRYDYSKWDWMQFDLGAIHFRYPGTTDDGWYLLSRLSSKWEQDKFGLEGLVQYELRLAGTGDTHQFRTQLGMHWSPTSSHELKLAATSNFEWLRRVYRNVRGVFGSYTFHFGSAVKDDGLFDSLKRYQIAGQVYLDTNGNFQWDLTDTAIGHGKVYLEDSSGRQYQRALTNGTYEFRDLSQGSYKLWFKADKEMKALLTSPSPTQIVIGNKDEAYDFIYSDLAELSGRVFNDIAANGQPDPEDPLLEGVRIEVLRDGKKTSKSAVVYQGQYSIRGLRPGRVELQIDPFSLPAGYRLAALSKTVLLESRKHVYEDFGVLAERTLSGRVFKDKNKNRKWDQGEPGVVGAELLFSGFKTRSGEGGQFIFRGLRPLRDRVRYRTFQSEIVEIGVDPTNAIDVWVPVN